MDMIDSHFNKNSSSFSTRLRLAAGLILFLFCFGLNTPVFLPAAQAQEGDFLEGQLRRTAEETEARQGAQAAALEKKRLDQLKTIRFQDILKDPDNIMLNFAYAQSQVKNGDVLGASATLERILLIDPSLDKVRLFYAVVLFRLDNWTEAKRELELLQAKELPAALSSEVDLYIKQINRRLRKSRFAISQSLGYQFDTNRNAAPSSKKRYFANTTLPVSGTSRRRRDTSFLNITRFDAARDLGFQAGHEVFGSFTYFLQEQTAIDNLDLQSFAYDMGFNLKSDWVNFQPKFYASHLYLSREQYLRSQGGNFRLDKTVFKRLGLKSEFRIERQDFTGVTESPLAKQRDGRYLEWENGFTYALLPTMRVGSSFVYANKTAEEDVNAYERIQIKNTHTWLWPKSQFVINSLDLGVDAYDEVDIVIAARRRRDKTLRYRVTYGAPLETLLIGKVLPGPMKNINFTFTYEYFRSFSNITSYTYRNNKFQLMLSKRIEF